MPSSQDCSRSRISLYAGNMGDVPRCWGKIPLVHDEATLNWQDDPFRPLITLPSVQPEALEAVQIYSWCCLSISQTRFMLPD